MILLDKLYQIGELSKACLSSGAVHSVGDEKGQAPLVESCVDDLLALKCCIEDNRWAEFIDWRACPPRRRPTKNRTHSTEWGLRPRTRDRLNPKLWSAPIEFRIFATGQGSIRLRPRVG